MGKTTGFLEWAREGAPKRAADERVRDFREFVTPLSAEAGAHQSGRCMDCGVPTCHQGCPLGNLIPDFNDAVYRGKWREAWQLLTATNNFPEFTGRLCPAPCEAACVLNLDQAPVTIEQLEKEIIERAFTEGWVGARPPVFRTGKKVAIVGSGPAGLAAAAQLNQAGHAVTVFERDERLGGLLRYGIPDFKLEKLVIDRRLKLLAAEGVEFRTAVEVGTSPSWTELQETFDAVVVAIGSRRPRELDVPGRALSGVVQAMEYLSANNRAVAGGPAMTLPKGPDTRVVILGGGDTGSDCLGTSLRLGAKQVSQVELFPAPPTTRAPGNPWPQWPVIFRTSSSQEEGGERVFARMTTALHGVDGKLTELESVSVTLEKGQLVRVPGSERREPVDLLVLAMGFVGPEVSSLTAQLGVALDARGNVRVGADFASSVPGVWAVGDASRGASLIVWAIADGREAARSVDAALMGRPSALPTRGRDATERA
jgi:glutamate synthase (NADPH/NADH) small chain